MLSKSVVLARAALGSLILLALVAGAPHVSAQNEKETFTGFAINLNAGGRTATVEITIDRWSTDAERDRLLSILQAEDDITRANEKLLHVLEDMPKVGTIRTPSSLAWDLHFARQTPLGDGRRRIVLGTNRPIGFREAVNRPRSIDYPFTIVQIQVDADGRGQGKILPGTRLYVDDGELVLENYDALPVQFNEIRKVR
jgi:hypothetical protein